MTCPINDMSDGLLFLCLRHDGGNDQSNHFVDDDVAFGDYQVNQATVPFFDMDWSGETMVPGADFLRANLVLIAISQRKLYITPVKEGMFAD